jgi:predicted ATPase
VAQTKAPVIRTPDQRLRVFISSTITELADERAAAQAAIGALHLTPIVFELGARPHPPRALYRAYLEQSHIFLAVYWKSYGWIAEDMDISGIEDEYRLAEGMPKLIYIKDQGTDRDPRLKELIGKIQADDAGSYKYFTDPAELRDLIENDLALFLTERFQQSLAEPAEEERVREPNLPALVNLFVGREHERAVLDRMVFDDEVRLVTLTGPGGIGKSRLALEFAASVHGRFSDGAYLIRLQAISDPDLVGPTIAQTLRITEVPGVPIEKVLCSELEDKNMLLILDNFEQILPAANIVGEIVQNCPGIVALVTSRSPLNLRWERDLPIPPLDVPPATRTDGVEQLSQYEAVRLFIERARAVRSDFEISNADAPAVAEICHRLEGIPLAIELAAARIKLLNPEAMLARLQDRFALLKGGWRDLPERQRTLKGTIDWSYDLLNDEEKDVFTGAGVFTGGWTIDALQQVCDPDGKMDMLELTASLTDKSLISPLLAASDPRFTMLETIREYARERLTETDRFSKLSDRHADLILSLIEHSRPQLRSMGQERALERLEEESGNIRSALMWLIETGRHEDAAAATWTLWHFWFLHDHLKEGLRVTGQILEAAELSERQRARVMSTRGFMAFWFGDYATAMPVLTQALDTYRELGDREGIALTQIPLGFISSVVVGPEDALPRFEEALGNFRSLGDKWGEVLVLNARGFLEIGLGMDIPEGRLEETLAKAEELGTEIERGMASGNRGRDACAVAIWLEHATISERRWSCCRSTGSATWSRTRSTRSPSCRSRRDGRRLRHVSSVPQIGSAPWWASSSPPCTRRFVTNSYRRRRRQRGPRRSIAREPKGRNCRSAPP